MSLIARSSTALGAVIFAAALVMLPVAQKAVAETSAADDILSIATPTIPTLASEVPLIDVPVEAAPAASGVSDAEIECVAKVVHHEAGNQSRDGQLAVAHVLINRTRSGKFPTNVCDAANQPRQFFKLAGYNPRRDTAMWRSAVDVAEAALSGEAADTSKGAMFFHAAYARPDSFFRTRQRIVQLEDHIFYR